MTWGYPHSLYSNSWYTIRTMKRIFFLIVLALGMLMSAGVYAQTPDYDLAIYSNDVTFSKRLVAGQKVRVYAKIHNTSDNDITAYVRFYQGTIFIGDSQVVSVVAGGFPDEVFVDWTVPTGSFNIRTEIREQNPQDDNPSNDIAITSLFVPLPDADGDAVPDSEDLDDDNDGLEDSSELTAGSNPYISDTDSDGTLDGKDAYPTDPTRSIYIAPKPKVVPKVAPVVKKPEVSEPITNPVIEQEVATPTQESDGLEPQVLPAFDLNSPDKVLIDAQKVNWRTYEFESLVRGIESKQLTYVWEFGDGESSTKPYPRHAYKGWGSYSVVLKITDQASGELVVSAPLGIDISFFHIGNYQFWLLIALIILILLILLKILKSFDKSGNIDKKE